MKGRCRKWVKLSFNVFISAESQGAGRRVDTEPTDDKRTCSFLWKIWWFKTDISCLLSFFLHWTIKLPRNEDSQMVTENTSASHRPPIQAQPFCDSTAADLASKRNLFSCEILYTMEERRKENIIYMTLFRYPVKRPINIGYQKLT